MSQAAQSSRHDTDGIVLGWAFMAPPHRSAARGTPSSDSLEVIGGHVTAHLRLPTSFCAPNFAYLMGADARAAVLSVAQVTRRIEQGFDVYITSWKNPDLSTDAIVRPDGTITMPLLGDLKAGDVLNIGHL